MESTEHPPWLVHNHGAAAFMSEELLGSKGAALTSLVLLQLTCSSKPRSNGAKSDFMGAKRLLRSRNPHKPLPGSLTRGELHPSSKIPSRGKLVPTQPWNTRVWDDTGTLRGLPWIGV